jgi:hypothetical protein
MVLKKRRPLYDLILYAGQGVYLKESELARIQATYIESELEPMTHEEAKSLYSEAKLYTCGNHGDNNDEENIVTQSNKDDILYSKEEMEKVAAVLISNNPCSKA